MTCPTADLTRNDLVSLMVGRELGQFYPKKMKTPPGKHCLERRGFRRRSRADRLPHSTHSPGRSSGSPASRGKASAKSSARSLVSFPLLRGPCSSTTARRRSRLSASVVGTAEPASASFQRTANWRGSFSLSPLNRISASGCSAASRSSRRPESIGNGSGL